MLNLGAEYIWLDVLCLRQEHQGKDLYGTTQEEWDDREILRKEEWKVDLPMIGWVYHSARQVVCYLSGLGLPLSFKTNRDFEDDRCWFNRAWTLQETPQGVSIAGRTCHNNELPDERFMTLLMHLMLDDRLRNLRNIQQSTGRAKRISLFLEEMKTRKSSKPVDKVTGLVYLLQLKHIPIYDADQCEEDAWTELMNAADGQLRATFLFLYPKPNGDGSWRPSWQQLMTETFHDLTYICRSLYDDPNVHWTEKDGDWYGGPRMDACHVQGLADESQNRQCGELKVKDSSGEEHTFEICALHEYEIPDGLYTLLGAIGESFFWEGSIWAVGKVDGPEGRFRKVSVVWMEESYTRRLRNLNVYRCTETPLL